MYNIQYMRTHAALYIKFYRMQPQSQPSGLRETTLLGVHRVGDNSLKFTPTHCSELGSY